MKYLYIYSIIVCIILSGCSKVRESAGVTRKTIDEFQVIENPPLVIPPDFNLVAPEQLREKNIDNLEKNLAKEILFGLESDEINNQFNNTTMGQILSEVNDSENSLTIREEIDSEFAKETNTDGIFDYKWENEVEVLDAIKESERIRNNNFKSESEIDNEVPIQTKIIKKKKKKRFIFF